VVWRETGKGGRKCGLNRFEGHDDASPRVTIRTGTHNVDRATGEESRDLAIRKSAIHRFDECGNRSRVRSRRRRTVERRWKAEDYSEELFPEVAAQALSEADLPARVDPWEIIRWVHSAESLPQQADVEGRFGNPPITLFSGPRFFIDIYYWLDGATSIHQHSFTGAFQVLLGSSIHSRYSFREDKVINEQFSVGAVALEEVQLLKLKDVRMIRPGRDFIHSLFHLDRPSATITITMSIWSQ